jgi:hypothetical protein
MPKPRSKSTTGQHALAETQAFYITTDLVVSSRASLAPLASALPDAHLPVARLLVLNGHSRGSVETDFRRFVARLSALRGAALRSWRTAGRRVLDIGVQAGNDRQPFQGVRLSAATLKRVAALGIRIQVTIYRPGAYDRPEVTT